MYDSLPIVEFAFPGPLRDSIIASIESGTKTATSSLLYEYEVGDEALPARGQRSAVVDSDGVPCFVVETVAVQVVPLRDVSLDHAVAEGEGYASVAQWRAGHLRFWNSDGVREELGDDVVIDDDTMIVLESFRLVP